MDKISISKLKRAVRKYNITEFFFKRCLVCGFTHKITISGERLVRDTSCDCSSWKTTQNSSWYELSMIFNNVSPEQRSILWKQFITKESPPLVEF